jgi:RNA polymerase sigma-70 factor (ECF subfamily)
MPGRNPPQPETLAALESTAALLALVRGGDAAARERLCARYLPMLTAWAHGRLPGHARALTDTDDLAQVVLMRALASIDRFEPRREGAFVAYLRRALLNAVRDEVRRAARERSDPMELETLPAAEPSAIEREIGRETLEAYEAALALLSDEAREAVILRIEFGYSYPEIASALDRPSADAARMLVTRSVVRLAEGLRDHRA